MLPYLILFSKQFSSNISVNSNPSKFSLVSFSLLFSKFFKNPILWLQLKLKNILEIFAYFKIFYFNLSLCYKIQLFFPKIHNVQNIVFLQQIIIHFLKFCLIFQFHHYGRNFLIVGKIN